MRRHKLLDRDIKHYIRSHILAAKRLLHEDGTPRERLYFTTLAIRELNSATGWLMLLEKKP